MKRILTVLTLMCFIGLGVSEASFPVKKSEQSQSASQELGENEDSQSILLPTEDQLSEMVAVPDAEVGGGSGFQEEDWILLALWFFLGGFAAHRWYAGKDVGWNILYILTAGGCGVWAIIDLIKILKRDFM